MDIFIGVVVGLLVLMFLVTAHEFGHFIAARRNGVNVLEFGIGFPPRAIAWIKDPKTGKWRRLPRKEWEKEKTTKVVYSNGERNGYRLAVSARWMANQQPTRGREPLAKLDFGQRPKYYLPA